MSLKIATFTFLVILVSERVTAQSSGVCLGLTGVTRTRCLQAEADRAQQQAEVANSRARTLSRIHSGACKVAGYGREATAGIAGAATGNPLVGVAGGAAYDGGRAIGQTAAGNDGCNR